MLSTSQIEDLVLRISKWGKKKKTNPYFSDAHKFISELRERLSYHADFDVFPEKLINSAAPNEDSAEFIYRKNNYKQVTKPIWDKALAATYRIFNRQNFTIDWKDDNYKEYFNYLYPEYSDYVQFFIDIVHKMKFSDPNAVLAVKPAYIPGEFNEEQIFVADQTKMIDPIAELYSAYQNFEYIEGHHTLVLTRNYSKITVGGSERLEGLIFELYDDTNIWRIYQYGEQSDWLFDIELYYNHNWGALPAWKLKGIHYYDPIETLYYSHFMAAVPNLDQAAFLNSTQFGSINRIAFPTRWFYEDSCNNCAGKGWNENYETHDRETCAICSGTGKRMSWSFGKDYVIPVPENVTATDTTSLPTPPFGVLDPPVDSIKFLDSKVKDLLQSAFLNINIDVASSPNGQTATESKIDRDELFSFLLQISREEFYLIQESIDAHAYMRYGDKYDNSRIEVKYPSEFTIRSSADLTEELNSAFKANLPQPYISKLVQENISQRFRSDKQMDKVMQVAVLIDGLFGLPELTITSLVNTQVVEKWKQTLHVFIYQWLYNLSNNNLEYLDKPIEEIKNDLETMAKEMTPATTQKKATDIFSNL